jgi:hypothetical protein
MNELRPLWVLLGLVVVGLAAQRFLLAPNKSDIRAFRVLEETPDQLVIDVDYFYAGDQGADGVGLQAITARGGRSTEYWSYTPVPITPGEHTARIRINVIPTAPPKHHTDQLILSFYHYGGGSPFFQKTFSFDKDWVNSSPEAKPEPLPAPAVKGGSAAPGQPGSTRPLKPVVRLMNTDRRCMALAAQVRAQPAGATAETVAQLIQCLDTEYFYFDKGAAGAALVAVGAPAIPALIEALDNSQFYIAEGAARVLSAMGSAARPAVPALVKILQQKNLSLGMPREAAIALGKIGEIDLLIRIVEGQEPGISNYVGAQGLGGAGPAAAAAVPALIKMLNSTDPPTQMYAADALGAIGPAASSAVPRLGELSRSEQNFVRRSAGDALEKIGTPEAQAAGRAYQRRKRLTEGFYKTMGIFVWRPYLAAGVGIGFVLWALVGFRLRPGGRVVNAMLFVPAVFWVLYSCLEYEAHRERADIRVDLIVIYPFLAGITLLAAVIWLGSLLLSRGKRPGPS